jgi:hypothetical protein
MNATINRADIYLAAKAMLFALETSLPTSARLDRLARLLEAFGDPAPSQLLSPGGAAEVLLRHMVALVQLPAETSQRLHTADTRGLDAVRAFLRGRLPVKVFTDIGAARLYVVVLCLARLGDGASIH